MKARTKTKQLATIARAKTAGQTEGPRGLHVCGKINTKRSVLMARTPSARRELAKSFISILSQSNEKVTTTVKGTRSARSKKIKTNAIDKAYLHAAGRTPSCIMHPPSCLPTIPPSCRWWKWWWYRWRRSTQSNANALWQPPNGPQEHQDSKRRSPFPGVPFGGKF